MGFSASWFAVQGASLGALTEALRSEPFGVERLADDIPDLGIAELPEGWVVVVQADPTAAFRAPVVDAAKLGPAVAGSETAGKGELRGYEASEEVWRVIWDSESAEILTFCGEPPEAYDALVDMAGENIFYETPREDRLEAYREVILMLGLVTCGFRLSDPPEGLGWTELRPKG